MSKDKRNGNNYTLTDCEAAGARAAAYDWSPVPWGHWLPEQVEAYMRGYRAAGGR